MVIKPINFPFSKETLALLMTAAIEGRQTLFILNEARRRRMKGGAGIQSAINLKRKNCNNFNDRKFIASLGS